MAKKKKKSIEQTLKDLFGTSKKKTTSVKPTVGKTSTNLSPSKKEVVPQRTTSTSNTFRPSDNDDSIRTLPSTSVRTQPQDRVLDWLGKQASKRLEENKKIAEKTISWAGKTAKDRFESNKKIVGKAGDVFEELQDKTQDAVRSTSTYKTAQDVKSKFKPSKETQDRRDAFTKRNMEIAGNGEEYKPITLEDIKNTGKQILKVPDNFKEAAKDGLTPMEYLQEALETTGNNAVQIGKVAGQEIFSTANDITKGAQYAIGSVAHVTGNQELEDEMFKNAQYGDRLPWVIDRDGRQIVFDATDTKADQYLYTKNSKGEFVPTRIDVKSPDYTKEYYSSPHQDAKVNLGKLITESLNGKQGIINKDASNPNARVLRPIEENPNSVLREKGQDLVAGVTQVMTNSAMHVGGGSAFAYGTMLLQSFGASTTEALDAGADRTTSVLYGIGGSIAETAPEGLFGGIGGIAGKGALDDLFIGKLSEQISVKWLKGMFQYGAKSSMEGVEEVVTGLLKTLLQKATYRKDDSWNEILADQNILEQFVMGTLTSLIVGSPGAMKSIANGTDMLTGLTNEETDYVRQRTSEYNSMVTSGDVKTDAKGHKADKISFLTGVEQYKSEAKDFADVGVSTGMFIRNDSPDGKLVRNESPSNPRAAEFHKNNADILDLLDDNQETRNAVTYAAKLQAYSAIQVRIATNQTLKDEFGYTDEELKNAAPSFLQNDEDGKAEHMVINVESKDWLKSVFGHESLHLLKGTKGYDKLVTGTLKFLHEEGKLVEEVEKVRKTHKNVELTSEQIDEEVVANTIGEMFNKSPALMKRFADTSPDEFDKLKRWVNDKIKGRIGKTTQEKFYTDLARNFERLLVMQRHDVENGTFNNYGNPLYRTYSMSMGISPDLLSKIPTLKAEVDYVKNEFKASKIKLHSDPYLNDYDTQKEVEDFNAKILKRGKGVYVTLEGVIQHHVKFDYTNIKYGYRKKYNKPHTFELKDLFKHTKLEKWFPGAFDAEVTLLDTPNYQKPTMLTTFLHPNGIDRIIGAYGDGGYFNPGTFEIGINAHYVDFWLNTKITNPDGCSLGIGTQNVYTKDDAQKQLDDLTNVLPTLNDMTAIEDTERQIRELTALVAGMETGTYVNMVEWVIAHELQHMILKMSGINNSGSNLKTSYAVETTRKAPLESVWTMMNAYDRRYRSAPYDESFDYYHSHIGERAARYASGTLRGGDIKEVPAMGKPEPSEITTFYRKENLKALSSNGVVSYPFNNADPSRDPKEMEKLEKIEYDNSPVPKPKKNQPKVTPVAPATPMKKPAQPKVAPPPVVTPVPTPKPLPTPNKGKITKKVKKVPLTPEQIRDKMLKDRRKHHVKLRKTWLHEALDDIGREKMNVKDPNTALFITLDTMKRNIYKVFKNPAVAERIYVNYFRTITVNEDLKLQYSNRIKKRLAAWKLNRREREYGHMWGEREFNPESTLRDPKDTRVDDYYKKHKRKIDKVKAQQAAEDFRNVYEEVFNDLNLNRERLGLPPLEYRQGYFRHITDLKYNSLKNRLARAFGIEITTSRASKPTSIADVTGEIKTPSRYRNSASLQRKTDITLYDLYAGMDNYLANVLDELFHSEDLLKLRTLQGAIAIQSKALDYNDYVNKTEGYKDLFANLHFAKNQAKADIEFTKTTKSIKSNTIPRFQRALNEYIDTFAKTSTGRMMFEHVMGEAANQVATNIMKRFAMNVLGSNLPSALTQIVPIAMVQARAGRINTIKGIAKSMLNVIPGYDDGLTNEAPFVRARMTHLHQLDDSIGAKADRGALLAFRVLDDVATTVVFRSLYEHHRKIGRTHEDAVYRADEETESILAGRTQGTKGNLWTNTNPAVKMVTMFALEVYNMPRFMTSDLARFAQEDAKFKATQGVGGEDQWVYGFVKMFVMLILGQWLVNQASSRLMGRKIVFSPIDIIYDIYKIGVNERIPTAQQALRITDRIVEEIPIVGGFFGGGRIPISSALPDFGISFEELLKGIKDEKVDWKELQKEWSKPLFYLGFSNSGSQIKKSWDFWTALNQEIPGVYDGQGNLKFETPKDIFGQGKTLLAGQYASDEAREYYEENYRPIPKDDLGKFKKLKMTATEFRELKREVKEYEDIYKDNDNVNKTEVNLNHIMRLEGKTFEQKDILAKMLLPKRKKSINTEIYSNMSGLEEYKLYETNRDAYNIFKLSGAEFGKYQVAMDNIDEVKRRYDNVADRKQAVYKYFRSIGMNDIAAKMMLKKNYPKSYEEADGELQTYIKNHRDMTDADKYYLAKYLQLDWEE